VDTHCHLDLSAFDEDRDAVMQRATQAGIQRIIVPAVDLPSNQMALQLAEQHAGIYAAIGIHPNEIPKDIQIEETIDGLRQLARQSKVVAIGEIGLDYYRGKTSSDTQKMWLERQLDLAGEMGLPIILHNREASSDLLDRVRGWTMSNVFKPPDGRPGVFHSFSADWDVAKGVLDIGFFLGFTGPLTYRTADVMRTVAARAPADRIVIETDAPFLTPHPHRGERNEPSYLQYTLAKLAEIRQTPIEDMARMTTDNACRLFGWDR